MKFRPCIDLHAGKVKQIVGSSLSGTEAKTNFVSQQGPSYYANMYKKDQLSGGHVIMLGPGNEAAALEALGAWKGALQVGGGITAGNAAQWLEAGAQKVIVTSFVFAGGKINEKNLDAVFSETGRENLVLDLSCRRKGDKYFVVTDRWQCFTAFELNKKNLEHLAGFCSEFLIHAADVEGKKAGIDENVLKIISDDITVPCVYAGGIASVSDIELIEQKGHGRVDFTVGSALDIFGGSIPYAQLARDY